MCKNTTMRVNGAWIKIYCVLCSKAYNTLHSCHNFPAGLRQAARGARICETTLLHSTMHGVTLAPGQDRCHLADDIFKRIFNR